LELIAVPPLRSKKKQQRLEEIQKEKDRKRKKGWFVYLCMYVRIGGVFFHLNSTVATKAENNYQLFNTK
jgi:hypothetical protein